MSAIQNADHDVYIPRLNVGLRGQERELCPSPGLVDLPFASDSLRSYANNTQDTFTLEYLMIEVLGF